MNQVEDQGKEIFSCEPCKVDNSNTLPEGFCLVCCEFLCKPCILDHRKNKASRNHKILENGDMPTSLQTIQILKESLLCMKHVDTEISHKCEDHDVYICDICLGKDHRHCSKVTDIATVEDTEDDHTMMKSLATLKDEILVLKKNKEKQLSNIDEEKKLIAQERGRIKQNLISKLKVLHKEQMEETDSFAKSLMKSMTEECAEIESYENDISALHEVLHLAVITKPSVSIGIVSEMIQNYICRIEKRLTQKSKGENIQLSFVPSVSTSDFNSLGDVKKTINDSDDLEYSHDGDMTFEKSAKLAHGDVKEIMKPDTPELIQSKSVGIASLMDGRVVLLDETNNKIKLYEKNNLIKEVSLSLKPKAMCKLPDDDIVVSVFQQIVIYTYSKSERTFNMKRSFPVKHGCVYLSHNGVHLTLLCRKSGHILTYIIETRQLHDGKIMNTFLLPTNMNPKGFICLSGDYFFVDYNGCIFRFEKDGKQIDDCPTLGKAVGLSTDSNDNLLVCCQESTSAEIYTVSMENHLSHVKTVPGLPSVESIYFDRKTKKFLFACHDGIYSVTVFE